MSKYNLDKDFDYQNSIDVARIGVIDSMKSVADDAFNGGWSWLAELSARRELHEAGNVIDDYRRRNASIPVVETPPNIEDMSAVFAEELEELDDIYVLRSWWRITKPVEAPTQGSVELRLYNLKFETGRTIEVAADRPIPRIPYNENR